VWDKNVRHADFASVLIRWTDIMQARRRRIYFSAECQEALYGNQGANESYKQCWQVSSSLFFYMNYYCFCASDRQILPHGNHGSSVQVHG